MQTYSPMLALTKDSLTAQVNNRGMWNTHNHGDARTVNGTLTLLQRAGYACFWLLANALLPASGTCWLDDYGGRPTWSNMLCAHEPPVLALLDRMAFEAYAERQSKPAAGGRASRRKPRGP